MTANTLSNENTYLKTRLQIMEVDIMRKDKLLKELMVKQEATSSYNSHHGISPQNTNKS